MLRKIKEFDPEILVILLTASATVETAVEAMKIGAYHFANKPFNLDDVMATVERALETTRLRREVRQLRANEARPYSLNRIVGVSAAMSSLRNLIAKVAVSPTSIVLRTGESGTGKDLVAKVLHYTSDRALRPFMNITCSALPEALLESELFGHERGAFTDARLQKRGLLETAEGGTVFLDEISEMVPAQQAKLLRFLEEKTFSGSAAPRTSRWTSALSLQRTGNSTRRSRRGGSGAICSTGSTSCRSSCRRSGRIPRTSPCSWIFSSTASTASSGRTSLAQRRLRSPSSSRTAGPAMSGSGAT